MKFLILAITILITTIGYSQKKDNGTIFDEVAVGQTHTVTINTSNYSSANLDGLKGGLLSYYEKIINITSDQSNNTFSFTYSEFMQIEDLISLFEKHKIDYERKIISNKLNILQ